MNILLLIDVLPPKYSGLTLRMEIIFNELKKFHKVYFLYLGNKKIEGDEREILEKFCTKIMTFPLKRKQFIWGRIWNVLSFKHGAYAPFKFREDYDSVRKQIQAYICEFNIELIHVFGCFTAQYVKDINEIPKLWDLADSYSLDIKRQLATAPLLSKFGLFLCGIRLFNYETEIIRKMSKTIFVSQIDADVYKGVVASEKIIVIPNGVDLDYFSAQQTVKEDYPSLIFTGHMSFPPNIEAVDFFIGNVFQIVKRQIPDVKLYIVGSDVNNRILKYNKSDAIIITGAVDDIRVFLDKATVFVNPMISGCGIKNKLLQAMAMKKPVVSTSLGAEAVQAQDGVDFMIADNANDFANKIIELLGSDTKRLVMGENARKTVEKNYNWQDKLVVYKQLYDGL